MSCWLILQNGLWNCASFFYWKLFLLLSCVGDDEAPIPIVLKVSIWRLVKGRVEHPISITIHLTWQCWPEAECWDFLCCPPSSYPTFICSLWQAACMHILGTYSSHFPTTFVVQLSSGLYKEMRIIDLYCMLGKGQRIESSQLTWSAWQPALWFPRWHLERAANWHGLYAWPGTQQRPKRQHIKLGKEPWLLLFSIWPIL